MLCGALLGALALAVLVESAILFRVSGAGRVIGVVALATVILLVMVTCVIAPSQPPPPPEEPPDLAAPSALVVTVKGAEPLLTETNAL